MIKKIASPLQLDSNCRQISCHFDERLFHDKVAADFDVTLPAAMDRAVQKRKAGFIAGRYCAQQALAELGGPLHAGSGIGIGPNREPLWPAGFVGSITHTHGYAAAVVAPRSSILAVGVDSETWIEPASAAEVSGQILTSREEHAAQTHCLESDLQYLTLVFSAKESLFKCLFPLVGSFFDFHAAVITAQRPESSAGGEFRFELLEDLNAKFRAGYSGNGRYCVGADCVHTAIILQALARD